MDFDALITLVGDNEEAKTFIKGVQDTSNNHVQTINKNETLINNLKGDLDKFKQGNSLVKSKLGLEQLNEDSLSEALEKLGKKGDNSEEITNLKEMINKLNGEKTTLTNDYESKITNMHLDNMIANATAGASIQSDEAFATVQTLLKQGVAIEDGKAVYKQDGKTLFDGNNQPLTLESKLESIKNNPIYAGFFGKTTANGGGSGSNNGGNGQQNVSTQDTYKDMGFN